MKIFSIFKLLFDKNRFYEKVWDMIFNLGFDEKSSDSSIGCQVFFQEKC